MDSYEAFLETKVPIPMRRGIEDVPRLSRHLKEHQRSATEFALRLGSGALFLDTGLGKTLCDLEWSAQLLRHTNGVGLILAPLAVARQVAEEADRFGYDDVRVIRHQDQAKRGINICNYDRLDSLRPEAFGAVVLNESSIIKNFTGATTRRLISRFASHRFRLAETATPAPNDHMELGQHCEFLGIMPSNEMLMRWFVSDQTEMGRYRLKGWAAESFWDWMASWARMAHLPSDLGGNDDGYLLPPLNLQRHQAEGDAVPVKGDLFSGFAPSATEMYAVKRATAAARAYRAASVVNDERREPWVVWVDTNGEADAFMKLAGDDAIEVRGSQSIEAKEAGIAAFLDGSKRVLVTKPSIAGHGLNLQHCARTVFLGRTYSFELYYQAVRRFWRFGQKRPVDVHLIVAPGEDAIGRVLERKSDDFDEMKAQMVAASRRAAARQANLKVAYVPTYQVEIPAWLKTA